MVYKWKGLINLNGSIEFYCYLATHSHSESRITHLEATTTTSILVASTAHPE